MKFTLNIETSNLAYLQEESSVQADPWAIAAHLKEAASSLEDGFTSGVFRDPLNGQKVGDWSLTSD